MMTYILIILLIVSISVVAWRYKLADLLAKKFVKSIKKREPVSTSIDDVFPHFRSIGDYSPQPASDEVMNELAQNGKVTLGPGVYDFYLQSFCLDAGRHGPSSDSAYLIAPLKGKRSSIVRNILENSARCPDIPQHKIQTLIWAISSSTKYGGMSRDLQLIADQLLAKDDLRSLGKCFLDKIPKPIQDRLLTELKKKLPKEILHILDTADDIKWKIADARTTYEELERAAIRFGKAPVPKNMLEVKQGVWSLAEKRCFVRVFPIGYSKTRMQVFIPERIVPYFNRDDLGRINKMGIKDGINIKITFDDKQEDSKITLHDGREIPVWRFKKLEFSAPTNAGPIETFEIKNVGWAARDFKVLACLDPQKYPEIGEHIENARDAYHDGQMLKKSLLFTSPLGSKKSTKNDGDSGILSQWGKIKMDGNNKTEESSESENLENSIEDLISTENYLDAWDVALRKDHKEKIKYIGQWFEKLSKILENAFIYMNSQVGNISEEGDSGAVDFSPAGMIATPVNTNEQRLGFRGLISGPLMG